MAFTPITVTGSWLRPGHAIPGGTVEFELTAPMSNNGVFAPERVTATLNRGTIEVELAATDDPGTIPNRVLYRVKERIPALRLLRDYYIAVPANGGPIDLNTVTRLDRAPAPGSAPVTRDQLGEILGAALDSAPGDTSSVPWATNVRTYGATGDGETNDHAAIQAAIDACAAVGGGTVYLPAGHYLVSAPLVVTDSSVRVVGEAVGATILEKTDDVALLQFSGAAGPEQHVTDCGVANLTLRGGDHTDRLLDVGYATRFIAENLHLFGNADVALDTVEVWDSRFRNLYVEWCSSDTAPAVWVRSSRAETGDGSSSDSTNQVLFDGLLVEAWLGGAIRVDAGEGSPTGVHSIHFTGTKIETHRVAGPAVVVGEGASNVSFVDTYIYLDGFADEFDTPVNAVELGGDGGAKLDGCYIGVGDAVLDAGVLVTGPGAILTNVEGAYSAGAPDSGAHISVTSGADVTVSHIRSDGADESVAGLSEYVPAAVSTPLRVVGEVVTDDLFSGAPPQGTVILDTNNYRLWVKTDAGWKYVELT